MLIRIHEGNKFSFSITVYLEKEKILLDWQQCFLHSLFMLFSVHNAYLSLQLLEQQSLGCITQGSPLSGACKSLHSNICSYLFFRCTPFSPFLPVPKGFLAFSSSPAPLYPLMSCVYLPIVVCFLNVFYLSGNKTLIQHICKLDPRGRRSRNFQLPIPSWGAFFVCVCKFKCHLSVGNYNKFIMWGQLHLHGLKQRFKVFSMYFFA